MGRDVVSCLRLRAVSGLILLTVVLGLAATGQAVAQTPTPIATVQAISSEVEQGFYPVLAADPSGTVHAFWCSKRTGRELDPLVIVYAKYENGKWTEPVDVLASPGGQDALFPRVVVDDSGRVHLFWSTTYQGPFGPLYHSWAWIVEATSAQNWASPNLIADGTFQSDAKVDSQGRLHVVYGSVRDGKGICHRLSTDHGATWGAPTCIPRSYELRDDEAEVRPRLAIDSRDILHVVWILDDYSPLSKLGYSGRAIYYARSLDGGRTWSDQVCVDQVDGRQEDRVEQPEWGNVAVDGEDRVHVVWVGSGDMYRRHQWSGDGGVTWTAPQVMIRSGYYTGWQGMAVDSSGKLHVVWSGEGVQYTCWDGSVWAEPVVMPSAGPSPHLVQATMALGNQLHAVWQGHGGALSKDQPGLIMHAMLTVDAPSLAPRPVPTPPAAPQGTATPSPTRAVVPSAAAPTPIATIPMAPFVPVSGTRMPALIGVVPAALLVVLVILLRLRRAS